MTHVIALDVESAGGLTSRNGFTQLGACIVRLEDSKVIARFNEYANMYGFEWEKRCVEEFWMKFPERFTETLDRTSLLSTLSPWEVVRRFLDWALDQVFQLGINNQVYIITDNAPFDIGILRYFADRDIMYMFGEYREIVDVSSVYIGMVRKPVTVGVINASAKELALEAINQMRLEKGFMFKVALPNLPVSKTHNPVDDAEEMALYWAFFQKTLNTLSIQ